MERKELLIMIPAYNEEKNIGRLLDGLKAAGTEEIADILVMDDASTDGTAELVRRKGYPVVTHVFNLGYGSGLQVGYKYAVRKGYRYVIQIDGDGQHDVSNIRVLYNRLKARDAEGKEPDVVLGSRFVEGSVAYPISLVKRFAYGLFRKLIYLGTGRKIKDPTTGLWGVSRRAFTFYSEYSHFDDKYPDANMIMEMLLLGFRVEEVPAVMSARTEGISMHSGLRPFVYMFRMMFSILAVWMRIRLFHTDAEALHEKADS